MMARDIDNAKSQSLERNDMNGRKMQSKIQNEKKKKTLKHSTTNSDEHNCNQRNGAVEIQQH